MLRLLLLTLLLASQSVLGQHAGHNDHRERAATLIPNLGKLHHPVSTTNRTAQKFFDQGLTLV